MTKFEKENNDYALIYANNANHLEWLKSKEDMNEDVLKEKIKSKKFILAESETEILGCLQFEFLWNNVPFMNNLYIDEEENRAKGIGGKLTSFWETEMKKQGYNLVITSTQENEDAQHFYRKQGYIDAGHLKFDEKGPLELFLRKQI